VSDWPHVGWSAAIHVADPDRPGRTLCGLRIPDGYRVGWGNTIPTCRRCAARAAKT
jgi:hypothetical protein